MALHFVELKLGNKTYKAGVSTQGCDYVADFRGAIKNNFSAALDAYAPYQLTLFQLDGTTEIDPGTLVADLKEIPCKPMVVTVELPKQASTGRHRSYRGLSSVETCRRYLNAVAKELSRIYDFDTVYGKSTMDDLLAAKQGQEGETWDYRKTLRGQHLTTLPLPSFFSPSQWDLLKSLNDDTTTRIHDARLPQTINHKPYVIIPKSKYETKEYVDNLKSIAAKANVVLEKDELIVKYESELSGSPSS